MVISFKRILFILFLIPVLGSTCKKGFLCGDNNNYSFRANYVSVLPNLDSVHVGDTIWVNYNFPTVFTDTILNQMVDYSNGEGLGAFLTELKFTGGSIADPGSEYSVKSFKYILAIGSPAQNKFPTEGQAYNFLRANNANTLKVGMIADSVGTFAFGIDDASGIVKKGTCTRGYFSFGFTNTNQHLYLYQANRPGYVISDYEASHAYCFKVY